jgi:superfamily II DNA or RNA helicase
MIAEFVYDTVARKPQIVSEYLEQIREFFSVEDKALVFMRRRTGRSHMPVRKYAITNKGHFDAPFFKVIFDHIILNFPSLQIKINDNMSNRVKPCFISNEPVELKMSPRDYQLESATKALRYGLGIIVLPTSAGKTLTIALIAATAMAKQVGGILILVPNIQLVEQTYRDFIEYGIDLKHISRWTGNYNYEPTPIVIANNQILLSKTQDVSVLNRFNVIICDEVHKIGTAEKIAKLVKSLKAEYKFGFTGSLPDNNFERWSINRIFGPVIYEKLSLELRQDKFISKVRVVGLEMEYKNIPEFTRPSMAEPTAGYIEETEWLHTNKYRNATMVKIINKLTTNTLVLVDRIAHGEHLLEFFKTRTEKQIYFIQGSVEVEERERMRELMEQSTDVICIAISNIFSTGISIKNLHNVIFASIGKARIKIIQSIGRSLRLHHTKEIATIFDIADTCLTYGYKHYEERKKLYIAENIPFSLTKLVEK